MNLLIRIGGRVGRGYGLGRTRDSFGTALHHQRVWHWLRGIVAPSVTAHHHSMAAVAGTKLTLEFADFQTDQKHYRKNSQPQYEPDDHETPMPMAVATALVPLVILAMFVVVFHMFV